MKDKHVSDLKPGDKCRLEAGYHRRVVKPAVVVSRTRTQITVKWLDGLNSVETTHGFRCEDGKAIGFLVPNYRLLPDPAGT